MDAICGLRFSHDQEQRGVWQVTLQDGIGTLILAALLTAGSLIDARSMRLPDWVTIGLLVTGLLLHLVTSEGRFWEHAAAAAIGFCSFWFVSEAYWRRAGRTGLGLGDAKLLAAVGAWLGPLALAPVVLGASLLALAFAGAMHVGGTAMGRHSAVPFGPFLSLMFAAGWAATLAGWV
jgi:leader peptidase (prepilin peptidase)/N-methyltransferase